MMIVYTKNKCNYIGKLHKVIVYLLCIFTLYVSVYLLYNYIRKVVKEVPIIYKIDVLASLKEKGYNTTILRKEKLLAESTIQQLREKKLVSWTNIDRICGLLECQIGDILERKGK